MGLIDEIISEFGEHLGRDGFCKNLRTGRFGVGLGENQFRKLFRKADWRKCKRNMSPWSIQGNYINI